MLSASSPWLVAAAGRVVAALVETLFVGAATYGIVSEFVTIHLHWTVSALLPAAAIMIAAVGLSLMVAGATLVYERIQIVNDTVLMLVMIFSASALPLIHVPRWWVDASHAFPLTDGVGSLYNVMLAHRSVTAAWRVGGLLRLLTMSTAYLLAGLGAFTIGERVAKTRGALGRY